VPDRAPTPQSALVADCGSCFGLCCVVPAFAASADFAIDKPAHTPCPNLGAGFGCGIHAELRPLGFAGCTAYDCLGAGQRVAQVTFGGVDWRTAPGTADQMYAAFTVMRDLHEALWHLAEARRLVEAALLEEVDRVRDEVEARAAGTPEQVVGTDTAVLGRRVGDLLSQVSHAVRGPGGADLSRRDLAGRDLRGRDLRDADLRAAILIGADLRGVDLSLADLLGADLRGARLEGADLRTALFVTRTQVGGARVDGRTRLPEQLTAPGAERFRTP
jgi:uncharacterized protein YjbI with pentapeptide repeats